MSTPGTKRQPLLVMALAAGLALAGCRRHAATTADCRAILDRLVELELVESGYRDPGLIPRWQDGLARRFAGDLETCRAFRVRDELRDCIARARNPEEVAHRCLD
jgi:hypothetical protein